MLRWSVCEIGHKEVGYEVPGMEEALKCGQYCEDCGRFIGRWASGVNEKVWCGECGEKRRGI